eukprot:TRINITY_DN11257_c0_g2_i2.p1 TRINITY_DN11257_c0_g2~~TRINITY_DN11257_c0_g2_i2.p1  ORF type:complete len:507 (+),score=108.96 TRINITY_DN11257_c0_g2_i2:238-1758(+)
MSDTAEMAWQVPILVLTVLTSLLSISYGILLFRNWNSENVRVRGRCLSTFMWFGFSTMFAFTSQMGLTHYDLSNGSTKLTFLFFVPFALSFIAGPYVVKSLVLVVKFQLASEVRKKQDLISAIKDVKLRTPKQQSSSARKSVFQFLSKPDEWFGNRRFVTSEKFQVIFMMCWNCICMITPLSSFNSDITTVANLALSGLSCVLLFAFGFLMKDSSDFWGIKKEISYFGVSILIAIAVFSFNLVSGSFITDKNSKRLAECLTTYFTLFVVHIPAISLPLFKAEQETRKALKQMAHQKITASRKSFSDSSAGKRGLLLTPVPRTSSTITDSGFFKLNNSGLLKLLNVPEFQELFEKHLQAEFSLENLVFLRRSQNFFDAMSEFESPERTSANLISFMEEMNSIRDLFLFPGAPYCVNLPGKIRRDTFSEIESLRDICKDLCAANANVSEELWLRMATVFKPAANDILLMLDMDSFKRFKKTEEFRKFQDKQVSVNVVTSPLGTARDSR